MLYNCVHEGERAEIFINSCVMPIMYNFNIIDRTLETSLSGSKWAELMREFFTSFRKMDQSPEMELLHLFIIVLSRDWTREWLGALAPQTLHLTYNINHSSKHSVCLFCRWAICGVPQPSPSWPTLCPFSAPPTQTFWSSHFAWFPPLGCSLWYFILYISVS